MDWLRVLVMYIIWPTHLAWVDPSLFQDDSSFGKAMLSHSGFKFNIVQHQPVVKPHVL